MHEQVVKQEAHQRHIIEPENKLQLAMDYIDKLENRHHQNNLRLLKVPESLEENVGMFAFLVKLLDKEWKIKVKEEDFESAHLKTMHAFPVLSYLNCIIFRTKS